MAKYISEFVKRQQALARRAKKVRKGIQVWDSLALGPYVKKRHGALK
jgi:hypothetical protein